MDVFEAFAPDKKFVQLHGYPVIPILKKLKWYYSRCKFGEVIGDWNGKHADPEFSPDLERILARRNLIKKAREWESFPSHLCSQLDRMTRSQFESSTEFYTSSIYESLEAIKSLGDALNTKELSNLPELKKLDRELPLLTTEIKEREAELSDILHSKFFLIYPEKKQVFPLSDIPPEIEKAMFDYTVDMGSYREEPPKSVWRIKKPHGGYRCITQRDRCSTEPLHDMGKMLYWTIQDMINKVIPHLNDDEKERGKPNTRVFSEVKKTLIDRFGARVTNLIFEQFAARPKVNNLRAQYEKMALPIQLSDFRTSLIEWCKSYDRSIEKFSKRGRRGNFTGLKAGCRYILEDKELIYPKFTKDHYSIKNLFPLTLAFEDNKHIDKFVPIDFITKPGEKNFYLSGLHSGGKSFYLENLVTLHYLAQLGFDVPGEEVKIPRFNRIFYISQKKVHQQGKFESELEEIYSMLIQTRVGDALFMDEVFDSTREDVAQGLLPEILDIAEQSPATVFVCSHRNLPPAYLDKSSHWVSYTPGFTEEAGHIIPTRTLIRDKPNAEANLSHAKEVAKKTLKRVVGNSTVSWYKN